ncbi:PulJ/GspJ family protein [Oceanirhabdus sp. W0125-5]|uniref:PulJ/GspJ family protein n=1 Tax=Oceanirhabdus sp. W0125-5 TaxID=2999116 RepID=UPI0022F3281A|nr:type II secretion system protein [Oceanirhabdus sp. W0125-5]WBW99590.1 type II secretion system protein [Oceanirhabdus sp. W0125-5]
MMKNKKGFTLIELILVIGLFSVASLVIFSLFMSNYMRMEAQGRETYLQEDIDRGLTQLSDRLMGTSKIIKITEAESGSNTTSMEFQYYFKDKDDPYNGKLYLEGKDGEYTLKLDYSIRGSEVATKTLMSYLEVFEIKLIDHDGNPVTDYEKYLNKVCSLEINYTVATSYKKIVKRKSGKLNIKLRNI